jgi:hypothetical protein
LNCDMLKSVSDQPTKTLKNYLWSISIISINHWGHTNN